MIGYWRVLRAFDHSLVLYLAYWAIVGFAFFGVRGVLLNLYLLRLGFGIEFIGLLNAAGLLTWAALALPAGVVGRRIGLREAQVVGLVSATLGMALFLGVEILPRAIWPAWLFGCMVASWIGPSLCTVNGIPYVMAVASSEERNYAFPFQQALQAGMTLVGSLAAGVLPGLLAGWLGTSLADPAPFRWTLWITPLSLALGAALISRARSATATQDQTESAAESPRPYLVFVLLGLVVFLFYTGAGGAVTFFNVYLDTIHHAAPAQIGTIIAVAQMVGVGGVLLVPQVLARAGTRGALILTSTGQVIALGLLWAAPAIGMATLGFVLLVTMGQSWAPGQNLLSQEIVAPRWRGTTSAILAIGMGLGTAVASATGGYLVASTGFGGLFLVGAAVTIGATLLVLGFGRLAGETSPRRVVAKVPKQA